ncbi:uncharacterized protein IL334_004132 [Kwoniella shivajii]|uniref:Uncharacterized protein n=1 Tax=Kwoniella shivajii TaxID=564305 RepID=A0ABZ1CZH1_9TREE|nr:hypothetical protein IL334_004132 [Kwoniella shivajii]
MLEQQLRSGLQSELGQALSGLKNKERELARLGGGYDAARSHHTSHPARSRPTAQVAATAINHRSDAGSHKSRRGE